MRCGVHIRVSTDDQRDNGYSNDVIKKEIDKLNQKNLILVSKNELINTI